MSFGPKSSSFSDFSKNWEKLDLSLLRSHLLGQGRLTKAAAKAILVAVKKKLRGEESVLSLSPPLTVCGDVHGQFYDLCALFAAAGEPGRPREEGEGEREGEREGEGERGRERKRKGGGTRYLFLGDYVDRGQFGVETFLLLAAYKLVYPNDFFLLRGNHESRVLTANYNFKTEVVSKYDLEIYFCFMLAFDQLPLAATLTTQLGVYYCVHGGLSPTASSLDELRGLQRGSEVPKAGPMCDLLWADPLGDWTGDDLGEEDMREWHAVTFENNVDRGCSFFFGWSAVRDFLTNNGVIAIIRAHEVQKIGYLEHYFHQSPDEEATRPHLPSGDVVPPVITVFSAPNYCGMYGNMSAYMSFADDSGVYRFEQLEAVDSPYVLPKFEDAFSYSLPFIVEKVATLLESLAVASLGDDDGSGGEGEGEGGEGVEDYVRRLRGLQHLQDLRKHMENMVAASRVQASAEKAGRGLSFEQAYARDHRADYGHPLVRFRSKSMSSVTRGRRGGVA
jgi:serine/threonine-protein phosphatase 2B catalytic subunit